MYTICYNSFHLVLIYSSSYHFSLSPKPRPAVLKDVSKNPKDPMAGQNAPPFSYPKIPPRLPPPLRPPPRPPIRKKSASTY